MPRFEMLMYWATILGATALSLWSQTPPPRGDGARLALIIVNSGYSPLATAPADISGARALEEVLGDAGFAVSVKPDLNAESMAQVLRGFQSTVHSGDVVLVYYSGYVKQGKEEPIINYLLPVNYNPASEDPIYFSAINLSDLLEDLAKNKPKLSMMVLDASWDPKLPGQAGLIQPPTPSGTWIFASTGADQVTTETQITSGKMGFFTSALVKTLPQHGLDLTELVAKVEADVKLASKDTQDPASWSSDLPKFFFHEPDPLGEMINRKDRLQYVQIPAGTFWMGCAPASEAQCSPSEKPRHRVEITKGFWLGQTEVTNLAYNERYARLNKLPPKKPKGITNAGKQTDLPVVGVSWEEAQKYCNWVAEGGRLPTEAEWERAARAGNDDNVYPYTDLSTSRDYANFMGRAGNDVFDVLAPVKQFNPNQYKLYDMAGNVWEWVLDSFGAAYYGESSKESSIRDPRGPAHPDKGKGHVARGGSWNSDAKRYLRISYRMSFTSGSNEVGFRCLVPDTPEATKNFVK
jgi:formylglycine-generating enzyme required for sulfatase activity